MPVQKKPSVRRSLEKVLASTLLSNEERVAFEEMLAAMKEGKELVKSDADWVEYIRVKLGL